MTPEKVGDKLKSRIEKNIPIPRIWKGVNEFHVLIDEMEVSDSVLTEGSAEIKRCQAAINLAHRGRTGKRFIGRRVGSDKKRYWREE